MRVSVKLVSKRDACIYVWENGDVRMCKKQCANGVKDWAQDGHCEVSQGFTVQCGVIDYCTAKMRL
jgi:hypothetical protein